jgi:hypothetical protein
MKNLTQVEKRDIALSYIARFKDRQITANELNRYLQISHPGDFTPDDTQNVLNTLVLDGFSRIASAGVYQVTLKGLISRENGGYAVQAERNNIRANHLQLAIAIDSQDVSLYPWMLAIGGILSVLALVAYGFLFGQWNIPF